MPRFPVDAPRDKVIRALGELGFVMTRQGNHLSLERENADGTKTSMTLPNHRLIKGSTLRTILTKSDVSRDDFLTAFNAA